ncbi:Galactokinase [Piedraia hortae CBS 480.64]|uniref:Galactokinase n=1 Tax=Piedraia hortae CBS 480.64 TaxID=1314780 RepID=A0A6A7CAQ1_9PEZI|nr:Galactokinase [Piedraia hortae CBS 480.64]
MEGVPIVTSLSQIYPSPSIPFQTSRWKNLINQFIQTHGCAPTCISRSPGRVNLIGEHIDYCLYSVLPMATEADILIAVSTLSTPPPNPHKVLISSTQPAKFPPRNLPASDLKFIDSSSLEWTNYFKAGLRGATQLLPSQSDPTLPLHSILVDGNVPSGGGLSSSAAFVCASALAVLYANNITYIPKKSLVEAAVTAEREVGVNSGGMDQAASVFPIQDEAVYVSFVPSLKVENIRFPPENDFVFLIAQTYIQADKYDSAPECYNLRVVEVTLAAIVLAKLSGLEEGLRRDASPLGVSLRGFHDAYFAQDEEVKKNVFSSQLNQLVELVRELLTQEEAGYSREEISSILGLTSKELEERYMTKFPIRAERFMLRQRALHVFQEAGRVLRFYNFLSHPERVQNLPAALGDLMNETQTSCRDLYQNSCPELDKLCALAREAGAYGSRLTGAGWGGCSVHLVPKDKIDAVKRRWKEEYYLPLFPYITEEKLNEAIVISVPGSGSCVYTGDLIPT